MLSNYKNLSPLLYREIKNLLFVVDVDAPKLKKEISIK